MDVPENSSNHSSAKSLGWLPFQLSKVIARLPVTVIWALVAQGLISVTRLLTSMTVGGRFGSGSEEQLGYYSTAFGFLMILVALFEALITTPLTIFNQRQKESDKSLFSGHMLWCAVYFLGLIFSLTAIWAIFEYQFRLLPPELAIVIFAVSILAPLQLLREFSRRWLLANLKAQPAAWFEVVFAIVFLSGLFVMVRQDQITAVSVFLFAGSANLVGLAIWWWFYRRDFVFQAAGRTQQIRENLGYGRWVAGENVCSAATMYFWSWYLLFKIDEAAAGVFFACFTVVLLANPFLLGVASILAPKAAAAFNRSNWSGLNRELIRFGALILGVLTFFSVILLLFGGPITNVFFGPKYDAYFETHFNGTNQITGVLSLAMPLMGLSYVSALGLLAINRPADNFFSALAALSVLVIVSLTVVEPTLMTAAISFVISFAVAATARTFCLLRAFRNSSE